MKKEKKEKNFIKNPQYPGGKTALDAFIKQHLQYPEEALKQKVEGSVLVAYTVNDDGDVTEAEVVKGLGYGCDEEALRLVNQLMYSKVRNRGVISTFRMKLNIHFRLPAAPHKVALNYQIKPKTAIPEHTPTSEKKVYTITLNIPKK